MPGLGGFGMIGLGLPGLPGMGGLAPRPGIGGMKGGRLGPGPIGWTGILPMGGLGPGGNLGGGTGPGLPTGGTLGGRTLSPAVFLPMPPPPLALVGLPPRLEGAMRDGPAVLALPDFILSGPGVFAGAMTFLFTN